MQNDHLQQLLEGIVQDKSEVNSNSKKSEATQNILWRKKLWARIGKAIFLQGVTGRDGATLTSDGAAKALLEHWGEVSAKKDGSSEAFEALSPYVQEVPSGIL